MSEICIPTQSEMGVVVILNDAIHRILRENEYTVMDVYKMFTCNDIFSSEMVLNTYKRYLDNSDLDDEDAINYKQAFNAIKNIDHNVFIDFRDIYNPYVLGIDELNVIIGGLENIAKHKNEDHENIISKFSVYYKVIIDCIDIKILLLIQL